MGVRCLIHLFIHSVFFFFFSVTYYSLEKVQRWLLVRYGQSEVALQKSNIIALKYGVENTSRMIAEEIHKTVRYIILSPLYHHHVPHCMIYFKYLNNEDLSIEIFDPIFFLCLELV